MNKEHQNTEPSTIIGSIDGPTSVFVVGKGKKIPLKFRIKNYIYQSKRKSTAKKIVAGTHTLEELVMYAINTYGATAVNKKQGSLSDISRSYVIKVGNNCFNIEIDDIQNAFGVSFSGNKKTMKHFKKIEKDLYIYYGVSEDDINKKTERYLSLLHTLSL